MNLLEIENQPLQWYVDLVDSDKPFTKTRWGDSEWRAVLIESFDMFDQLGRLMPHWGNPKRVDCQGNRSHFYADLTTALCKLLRDKPDYIFTTARRFGSVDTAPHWHGLAKLIKKWIDENKLGSIKWQDMDTLYRALAEGELKPFVDAVRRRKVVVVGPRHLRKLELFSVAHYVNVPRFDAYAERDEVLIETRALLETQKEPCLVSFSAGMLTEVLIHQLHPDFGETHSLVDMGSLWDPFVGEMSRSYMKKMDPKVLKI
jgi:hypothetical protein